MSIYQEIILEHNKHPRNKKTLAAPNITTKVTNPLCGDVIRLTIKTKNALIEDIGFDGEGCAISTASASLLTQHARGKTISDLRKLDSSFMLEMLGIELTPNRLKCALLPLEALHKAINQKI